jgi:PPOX class probable F420-dependent enzyme
MVPQELQDLLKQRNNAILAVNRRSGAPHVTPVWYLWDGEDFYVSITTDRAKYANIQRDPSISLIVDEGPGYVAAYGEAEILDQTHPSVPALAEQLISKYIADEQREQFLKVVKEQNRVIIKLHPEKVVTSTPVAARTSAVLKAIDAIE